MSAEMASEAMEVITMAVDKHVATKNYEVNWSGRVRVRAWVWDLRLPSVSRRFTHRPLPLLQAAAQLIKSGLDKKFGAAWHCVIGEGFGFDITYQAKNMIYIVYGTIGILAYKC
jgi:hypothetical protein